LETEGGEGDGEAEKKKNFSCLHSLLQNFVKIEIVKNPLKKKQKKILGQREVGRNKRWSQKK